MLARRRFSALLLAAASRPAFASTAAAIRVGVLRFGTVSWEIDVIRTHGLAAVVPQELAAPQAAQIALQAGQVDTIVVDWMWVARQRATGRRCVTSPTLPGDGSASQVRRSTKAG
jgi:NitT/TauT family transport system substrate-binding protein